MIRRLVFILLLLAVPVQAAETVLYDVTTVTYQVLGQDIPPYVTAGISRWESSERIEIVDAGPQPAGEIRWTSESLSLGQFILIEAFSSECSACVEAYTAAEPRGGAGFIWLGGIKDPFASFYLTLTTMNPHLSLSTESFTVGRRVSPRGPKK